MADVVKTGWFGRKVTVLMVNGKSLSGELSEVTDKYIVVETKSGKPTQVMVHAIVAIRPVEQKEE